MTTKVGCCGYPVSVKGYQEIFKVVELNNTFYQYPRAATVEKWRRESREDFEFTVKANQEISHRYRLKVDLAAEAFDKMKQICKVLRTRVLLIQTPGSFSPDRLEDAYEFLKRTTKKGITLVWETRGPQWEKTEARDELHRILEEMDVPHVTDPFRTLPVYVSNVAYFRLHGLGERMYYYQYTDKELEKLYSKIEPFHRSNREVYVFFNNLSMFDDARRFMQFLERGEFPSLTELTGLNSIKAAIKRVRYPLTKTMLMEKLGWRVVELEDGKQVRLEDLLRDVTNKEYRTAEEVVKEMKQT